MSVQTLKTVITMHNEKNKKKFKLKFYAYSEKHNKENYLFTFKVPNYRRALSVLRKFNNVRAAYLEDYNGHNQRIHPNDY
jgi:hypothetical protein